MEIVTKIAPIALALIMLGLGLGLSVKDFTRILRNPNDFIVGFILEEEKRVEGFFQKILKR